MKPYVSALIDTYNHGRFIEDAVESVLAQDFPASEMEILVVDDGSTDDTAEQVRKFGSRVRYLYKSNGGQASAFNFGIPQTQGEIVAFLDGDAQRLGHLLALLAPEIARRDEDGRDHREERDGDEHPFHYLSPLQVDGRERPSLTLRDPAPRPQMHQRG